MKILKESSFLKIEVDDKQYFLEIKKEEYRLVVNISVVNGTGFDYKGQLHIYPGSNLNLDIPEGENIYERCIVHTFTKTVCPCTRIFTYNAAYKTTCELLNVEGAPFISINQEKDKEIQALILQTALIFVGVKA